MHEAVRIIKDEHRSIAAVLHGLTFLTREIRDLGAKPDFSGIERHAGIHRIVFAEDASPEGGSMSVRGAARA